MMPVDPPVPPHRPVGGSEGDHRAPFATFGTSPPSIAAEPIRTQVTASVHSRGAIVPERQRCTCPMFLCRPECRACNHSGRDLEETCIADPDWEPDDEYLAIRENRFRGGVR